MVLLLTCFFCLYSILLFDFSFFCSMGLSVDSDLASIEGYAIRAEMFKKDDTTPLLIASVTSTKSGLLSQQIEADGDAPYAFERTDVQKDPKTFSLQLPVEKRDIELWSPEDPYLYTIVISLYPSLDAAFTASPIAVLDNESVRFGIREVDVGGNRYYTHPHSYMIVHTFSYIHIPYTHILYTFYACMRYSLLYYLIATPAPPPSNLARYRRQ